jgi:hypothetical protein
MPFCPFAPRLAFISRRPLILAIVTLLLCATGANAQTAPARAQITQAVSDGSRITLPGSVPPQAQAQFDQGPLPDSTPAAHILMVLKRSASQQSALDKLIEGQHETSSPLYHEWLKPEQFAAQFGPADADLHVIGTWLESQGFTINKTSKGKQVIDFSGTAGQVKAAFHTELHTYVRGGVTFHSNNSNPQIPAALAPVVSGLFSLNDIKPKAYLQVLGTAKMDLKTHTAQPTWNSANQCYNDMGQLVNCTYYIPTPGDMAVQYNLANTHKNGVTGKGVTIGIVDDSNIDLGVVQNYRKLFGLDPNNLPAIVLNGNDPAQDGDATEAYLDVEAASAMAPDASIDLYVSGSTLTTSGLVSAIVNAVDDDAADILSVSYGECEQEIGPSGNQFFYQYWQQAAAQGESVFVAAGDSGSAGCDNDNYEGQATLGLAVNGFASTPYDTAVGATDFYYPKYAAGSSDPGLIAQVEAAWGGSTTSIYPESTLVAPLEEQPWNNSFGLNIENFEEDYTIVAGGGGASSCIQGGDVDSTTGAYGTCTAGYPKPSWQTGAGVPKDGTRDVPDVALFGANGLNLSFWPICQSVYDCLASTSSPGYSIEVTGVGGTSASTPAMAGIVALVDQSQKGRQGNINARLYALAAQYPGTFHDVMLGNNNVPCVNPSPDCSLDTDGDGFYTLQHYSAGPGYDQASGLGSIDGGKLIANWNKVVTHNSATWTALNLSQTKFKHGTPVTATAIVSSSSGEPSGLVAVETSVPGQTGQGVITIAKGEGSASFDALPGGTYTVEGLYNSGDGNLRPSTSFPVAVTVSPEESTATLTGTLLSNTNFAQSPLTNGETVQYGDSYYLDTTIAGKSGNGAATGAVTYLDGKTPIGTANLSQYSLAELVAAQLAPGAHQITARYSGDSSFDPATSASLSLTVVKAPPYVFFEGFTGNYGPPILAGQVYTATILVASESAAAAPTGTVTIAMGSLPAQTVKLATSYPGAPAGVAVAYFTPPTAGSYPMSATYNGDANYAAGSLTYPATITVTASTLPVSTTTLTSSTTQVGPDGTVLLSATVTGKIAKTVPTGNVTFVVGIAGYEVNLDVTGKGSALIGGQGFATGSTVVTALYSGDKNYSGSTSKPLTIHSNQGDYTIAAAESGLSLTQGSTGYDEISLQSVLSNYTDDGLSGNLALSCATSSPELDCHIKPGSVFLASDGKPSSAQVVIDAHCKDWNPWSQTDDTSTKAQPGAGIDHETPPGLYQVTISGNLLGVQHSLLLHLKIEKRP